LNLCAENDAHVTNVYISERMEEIMDEEISTVEDSCTISVVEEDVKEKSTENQGMGEH